ncbi:hypothetical protein FACS1894185_1870 [Betaproteobacteria bacterium]|nr:hypothetical protein FACS1894185_1870 [Betaproteobacteria bacterium]GHU16030.1 hypothetical protein FACS189441_8130 [Betaproteobacteria bacterium]
MKHTATSEPSTIQAPKLRTEDFERVEFRGPGKIATREAEEAHARSQFETGIGKQRVNIALDPDIVRWFKQKAGGRGYQTLINAALRDTMREQKLEEVLRRVIREELRPD